MMGVMLRADATAQVVWACREVAVSRMGPAAGVDMKPIVRWLMAALVAVAAFAVAAWVCGAQTLSALMKDAGIRWDAAGSLGGAGGALDEVLVDKMRRRVIDLSNGNMVRDQARGVYGIDGTTLQGVELSTGIS